MKVCHHQRVELKQDTAVTATAKSLGIPLYNFKAQTSRFAFLFCNIIVDIFHYTILLCNYTREMYKPSLHLLPLLINLKYGEHKEEVLVVMVVTL